MTKSRLIEALSWNIKTVELCLFVATPADNTVAAPHGSGKAPEKILAYTLEDPYVPLPGLWVDEYDLIYSTVPDDIDAIVRNWLAAAIDRGAVLAWFVSEGSFHFQHILTADIARQVYGATDQVAAELALGDDHRRSPQWAATITQMKDRALASGQAPQTISRSDDGHDDGGFPTEILVSTWERLLNHHLGEYERTAIRGVRERRTAGVEELTFNVVNIVLDFDAGTATLDDELDPTESEAIGLNGFFDLVDHPHDAGQMNLPTVPKRTDHDSLSSSTD